MIFWRYWPLTILLLGLAGCGGTSPGSISAGKSLAELIESGNKALARGEIAQALADFNGAVEAQPESAPARERRATAFLKMQKYDQAVNDCNAALKIDSKFVSAYFTRGLAEKDRGNPKKAIEDFSKALDNGPPRADVLMARGALYHSEAKRSIKPDEAANFLVTALKDFDRAVKLDPHQAECRVQRATIYLDMSDYEGAVADCDEALKTDSKLAAAYVARAHGECELSEIDRAIADCDAALRLDENILEAYVIRARARLEKSSEMRTLAEVAECERAVDDCQKAIALAKKFQGDAEGMKHAKTMLGLAHELRGSIYHNLRVFEQALAEYEQALSHDPYLVSALVRRAVTRTTLEDFGLALNDCNTAVGIDGTRPAAYAGRGWVHAMKWEFPKAIEDFTQAVSLDRKCAKAYSGRATVYAAMATQELVQAQELVKMRRATDQAEISACVERANALRQRCIDDATKAIEANRHLARAYLTRGLIYARQEAPEKALADFNAAVREDPVMAKAYYNRGVHFALRHQWEAAIKDFEAAGKLQPDTSLIDYRLYQVYKEMGDPILMQKYYVSWQEKRNKKITQQEQELESPDFTVKHKPQPDSALRPDSDLEPLDKAKIELRKKLDATAEKL